MAVYHPQDTIRGDDYPDIDEVRFFIEKADIEPIEQKYKSLKDVEERVRSSAKNIREALEQYNNSTVNHNIFHCCYPYKPFTVSALVKGEIDRKEHQTLFSLGDLNVLLKPYFLITLQTISNLK